MPIEKKYQFRKNFIGNISGVVIDGSGGRVREDDRGPEGYLNFELIVPKS
jgi:hypothetical protein